MKNVKWLSLVLALVLCLFALPAQAEVQTVTIAFTPQVELPDNDELFAMYAEGQLYGYGGISFFGTRAGDALSGVPKQIYSGLKPMIEAVAAGTQTSTVFTVELTAAYPGAADINAAADLFQADFSKATDALLADCPFELFWFDKISKTNISMTFSNNDPWTISKAVVSMPVAGDYAKGEYTVNALPAKVAIAASAAQTLVANNASLSDMEKLEAYKAYICGAVSYNTNAVTNKEAYGDPWQLIYVFDGDSSTNVVCEGYSKAFQYLCDLSTFSNKTLAVYTVSGTMAAPDESGVVGAGPHMWNIVSMDGKNYLVDVTNSEYETVGMGGELFMAKANKGGSVANGYVVAGYNDTPVTYKYDSDQKALWGESVLKLAENVPVASITSGTTVTEYMDFADALVAWTDGTTLTLLDDVSYDSGIAHRDDATRTFVGGEHTLTLGSDWTNYATLTIKSGTIDGEGFNGIYNFGTLTIENGTITGKTYGVYNQGTLTIESVTINAGNQGVRTEGSGQTFITGGTINAYFYAVSAAKGITTITGNVQLNGKKDDLWFYGGAMDLSECTALAGFTVLNKSGETVSIGNTEDKTLRLPANYYVFDIEGHILPELADDSSGTIGKHTSADHKYEYTPNSDGLTHNKTCTVGCGVGETNVPHTAPDAEDKCVCGAQIVAQVGTAYYSDFSKALENWTDGTTLTLLDNVTYDASIEPGAGTRTFDGGDYTLDMAGKGLLNEGTLTIQNAKITSNNASSCAVENVGIMMIKESTITNSEGTAIGNAASLTVEYSVLNANSACLSTNGDTAAMTNCTLNCQEIEIEYAKGKLTIAGDCDGWEVRNTGDVLVAIGTDIELPAGYYMFELTEPGAPERLVTSLNRNGTIRAHEHKYTYTDNGDGTHSYGCTCGLATAARHDFAENSAGEWVCDCDAKAVAMVEAGGTATCYTVFADAVAAWTDGTTLTLLDDVSYNASEIILGAGASRTFAGGKYTLSLTNETYQIYNSGTLTIASGTIIGNGAFATISNYGTLTIEDGTITKELNGAIAIQNLGTLTIKNGTISAKLTSIAVVNDGSMTMSGGALDGNVGIHSYSGTTVLERGTVTATGVGAVEIRWRDDSKVEISNTNCNGWTVQNVGAKTAAIGADKAIQLPADHYVFVGNTIVTELAGNAIGGIGKHTSADHKYEYTPNGDVTHTKACTAGCGVGTVTEDCTLDENDQCTLCKAQCVASITSGSTVTKYTDFGKAVAAWTDGTTLTLLDNVTYDASIEPGAGTRTFDGGDYTLDLGSAKIKNTGTLTITSGTITSDNMAGGTIENWGELIINGNSVINNNENAAVVNFNKFEATGGTLTASTGLDNEDDGVAVLNGTTLSNVLTWGNVTLTNCTITLDGSSTNHLDFRGGKVTINGDCAGWRVIYFGDNSAAVVGTDIVLPDNYYLFRNATIIPTLEYHADAIIGKHTDHNYEYTPNGDVTHTKACTAGCGVGTVTEDCTLDENNQCTLCEAQCVASITSGSTVTKYTDFAKAVAAWTDGTTLTLLDDVSYDSDINLGAGTRTFVGGEHTLTLTSEANQIYNDGTLTIASGTITSEGSYAIQNSGTLNIEGGMVSTTARSGIAVDNIDGTLNITGGTVSAPGLAGYAIVNHSSMTLDGGTIEGYSCIENSGTAELKSGTVTASDVYALYNAGTATLSGADLATEGNNPAVFCNSGKTTISGGTLASDGTYVIRRVGGTLTITTTGCNGWKVISSAETATIGEDITLPEGYCLFDDDGKFIANLEADVIGTITAHTHKTLPIDNKDGKSHDLGCACGAMSNQEILHFVLNTEDKCVCGAQLVAKVGEAYYSDIAVAMGDWENNGGTMTLLRDATYTSEYGVSLWSEKPYTFVGDGCTLELQAVFSNHAQLTIESGTIKTPEGIHNVGTLHVKGGTIESESSGISNEKILTIENGVTVTAKTVCIADSQIRTGNDCKITINGGTFSSDDYVMTLSGGTVAINGGSMKSVNGKELLFENGDSWVTIKDGVIPDAGWKVRSNTYTPIVLSDCLSLPSDHYVFVGDEIIDTLEIAQNGVIKRHSHSYTATADDDTDTITYACTCGIGTETAKLLASAEPLVYNGMAYISTVKLTGSTVAPAVVYTQNGQGVAEMKNAGDYTVIINWHGKEVSMSITILPADIADATVTEGSRAYDATAKWVAPLELDGVIDGDDVSGWAEFQLPGINVGEYTEATLWEEPELTGADAGNYTLAPQDVTFVKATITKAAADKWSVNVAAQEVLVGSGLNEVVVPATGTGIGNEVVKITAMALYSDAELQTPATDADISGLGKDESITLYYKATADNYEAATGPMTVKAIAHQHEWTYAADEATDTITAKCSGTIGNCPRAEQSITLNAPDAVYSGNPVEAEVTPDGADLTYNLRYTGTNYDSADAPANVGDYTVTMTVGDKSVSDTFTISPKDISVVQSIQFSLAQTSFVYSGEAPALNVTGVDSSVGNYTMQENTDYTVGTVQVNAGSHKLTVTGMGNYTGSVELAYEINRAPIGAAVITAEAQVYTGEALMPNFTVTLGGKELKDNEDFVFEVSDNVNVGEGKIVITGIYNYEGQAEGTFDITSAPADLTAETYLGESQTGDFTYGDVITIKGAVTVDRQNTFSLRRAPAANEVALYLEGGNEVIAGPVAADPATGEFTMTYDTTNKDIQIGQRNLKLVYVSDGNKDGTTGSVTVTLLKKELTIARAGAADREYEKDNKLVAVTGVDLDGIAAIGDDVKADLTGVQGILASDNAGDYTTMVLPKLNLTGSDKDYYTIAADEAVPTDVTITKAQLVSAELPTDVTLDTYLATADQVAVKLPALVVYTASNGDTVALDAAWTCADFDATPKAVNTFAWTVDASTLTNYELSSAVAATGTIKVTNTDALPVVITATDDSITFAEQPYGVAGMFAVDANAGDAHYEVVSGDAVLNGATLTVNTVGEIVIRLTTEANGAYAAAEATATLTVTKADPAVTAPAGLTATYGQTLFNVALPDHDKGTWTWANADADVGNAGTQTHEVIFTPNDTTNWNTLTLDAQVNVAKANTEIALVVFNGETETRIFTYGETVTVKAQPQRPPVFMLRSFTAPVANQMALFLGDEQISEAVDADENGIYTMTIPTADKALKPGDNAVTIKYVGTDNMEDAQGVVTVTLLKKKLSIVNMAAKSREYQPENQQVDVTAVELEGKLEGDDVAVGTLTAQVSSANVGSYAAATLPQTVPLAGEDADYYEAEGNVEVPVPQKVNITQATPEPTGTGADAGQPAVTPVTEDGKTLADIPLSLPEGAYNVPGTIHWVDGDDTPVEEGKEYAWVFIPEDPNYAPVNGTVVIYPAGEAPVITAPTAAQTVTVVEGETGTMTVTATEAEKYQWYIDRNDGKGYVAMDGATAATYTTSKVNTDNDGFTYYCQVSNAYGESKSPVFTLKVKAEVDVPQTGDEAQLGLWLALMVLSLGGMAAMVMNRKRREN